MFAAEFQPVVKEEGETRRRSPRAPVALDAQIGTSGRTLCKVVDISAHGVRLHTYSALKKGSTIWLLLPKVGHVAVRVMWADDLAAGCQFETPLSTKDYLEIVGHARPSR